MWNDKWVERQKARAYKGSRMSLRQAPVKRKADFMSLKNSSQKPGPLGSWFAQVSCCPGDGKGRGLYLISGAERKKHIYWRYCPLSTKKIKFQLLPLWWRGRQSPPSSMTISLLPLIIQFQNWNSEPRSQSLDPQILGLKPVSQAAPKA